MRLIPPLSVPPPHHYLFLVLLLLLPFLVLARAVPWDGASNGSFKGLAEEPYYQMESEVVVDGFLNITGNPEASPLLEIRAPADDDPPTCENKISYRQFRVMDPAVTLVLQYLKMTGGWVVSKQFCSRPESYLHTGAMISVGNDIMAPRPSVQPKLYIHGVIFEGRGIVKEGIANARHGGIIFHMGETRISGSTFTGGYAQVAGGAIYSHGRLSNLIMSETYFEGNQVSRHGDTPKIKKQNAATCGAAVKVRYNGEITLEGGENTFTRNTVLYHPDAAQLHVHGSKLSITECRQGTFQDSPVVPDASNFSFVHDFRGCPHACNISALTTAGRLKSSFDSSADACTTPCPVRYFCPGPFAESPIRAGQLECTNRTKCAIEGAVRDDGMRMCEFAPTATYGPHSISSPGCRLGEVIVVNNIGIALELTGSRKVAPLDTLEAMGGDGSTSRRHFTLGPESVLKLNFLRLFGGKAVTTSADSGGQSNRGGSIYMSGLKALFEAQTVLFDGCGAGFDCAWIGGTLALRDGSVAIIIDSTFQNSRAGSFGGAVSVENDNTALTLTNTAFISNSAGSKGAGIYAEETVKIRLMGGDNIFRDNDAAKSGHSIYLKENASTEVLLFDVCRSGSFQDDRTHHSQLSGAAYFINVDFDGCQFECTYPETTIGYAPHFGANACSVPCTAGMYFDTTPSNTSLWACRNMTTSVCPPGSGFSSASARVGLLGSDQDDGICTPCVVGKHKSGGLAAACNVCGQGRYSNTSGAPECLSCRSGKFLASDHTSEASLHDEESDCDLCDKGRFNSQESSGDCYPCEFSFKQGETSCEGCDVGKYLNRTTGCQECSPGKFTDARNQLSCSKCASGSYTSRKATAVCTQCAPGKYGQRKLGATSESDACANCTKGRYVETKGNVGPELCKYCPIGKWSGMVGLPEASLCVSCSTGRYSSTEGAVAKSVCVRCEPGKFSETLGAGDFSKCMGCPTGFFQHVKGSAYCLQCLPGRFSNETGLHDCYKCDEGQYRAGDYQDLCKACPEGFSQNMKGQAVCLPCLPGKYAEANASIFCAGCPSGWLQEDEGESSCVKPNPGFISAGGASSIAIPEGRTADQCNEEGACIATRACAAGTFENGNRICISCPKGFSSTEGKTTCDACGKGKYSNKSGAVCDDCPAGWFQDQNIKPSHRCTNCPLGYGKILDRSARPINGSAFCRDLGWKKPSDCRGNSFLDTSTGENNQSGWFCRSCPMGTDCSGVDVTSETLHTCVLSGWWQCPEDPMSFAKCVIPGACPGTDAVAPDDCLFDDTSVVIGCAKGRNTSCSAKDNILCAACAKGYVPFGDHGECVACELGNSYTMVSVYGLVLVMAMVVVVALKIRGSVHEKGVHNSLKRTILSHVQMISIIMALDTKWPNTFSVPMRMLTEVMTGAGAASSFSCSLADPGVLIDGAMLFYLKLTVNALMPMLAALITYAYWIILAPQHRCFRCGKNMLYSSLCSRGCKRCLRGRQRRPERSDLGPQAVGEMSLRPANHPTTLGPPRSISHNRSWSPENLSRQLRSTRDAWLVTCIYFTYFFFPRNIRLGFQAFECMTVCGHEYLFVEPQEKCWEANGRHMWWVLCVATPTLIVYVFLLPTSTLLYLQRFRHEFHRKENEKKQEKMMFRLGFLYSGYADACWWFDSVVLLRKIFVILSVTFGGRNKDQLHYCMAVLVSMLFVQERLRPYHGERKGALHLQARAASMKKMELALARKKNNPLISISEEERLSIVGQEDKRERAIYNYLHNTEVASIMILIFSVWIAQFFLMEGSCQQGTAYTDSSAKTMQDTAPLCSVLGAFGVGLNGLFMLWTCFMFIKSYMKHKFKYVRRAQRSCKQVIKRCWCIHNCVEPEDVMSVIVIQDGPDPLRDIALASARFFSNPMRDETKEDEDEKKKNWSTAAAKEIEIEMTVSSVHL